MIPKPTLTSDEADRWRPWLPDHCSADVLAWYHAVAQVLGPNAVCVEVGVAHGRTVIYLAEILAALGNRHAKVYAVDPWEYPIPGNIYPRWPAGFGHVLDTWLSSASSLELERVYPVRARSVHACKMFRAQSLDLVMIDADHSLPAVEEDIEAWAPLVKPGRWLSGHDYTPGHPGVIEAVDRAFPGQVEVFGIVWVVEAPAHGL